MKGGCNVFVCLIWEEPLLPNSAVCMEHELGGDRAVITVSALVAILSSFISVSKDNIGTEEYLCRDNLFLTSSY